MGLLRSTIRCRAILRDDVRIGGTRRSATRRFRVGARASAGWRCHRRESWSRRRAVHRSNERGIELRRGAPSVARFARPTRGAGVRICTREVELIGTDLHPVARGVAHGPRRAGPSARRNRQTTMCKRGLGMLRRNLAPDAVDQVRRVHGSVVVEQQNRQQRAWRGAAIFTAWASTSTRTAPSTRNERIPTFMTEFLRAPVQPSPGL